MSQTLAPATPIDQALLLVTRPNLMLERVGGMTVIERQLHTLSRAGVKRVFIGRRLPDERRLSRLRLPEGLEIVWSAAKNECQPPYVTVSADHFVRVETLRYVLNAGYGEHTALEDAAGMCGIRVVPYRSDRFPEAERQPLPPGSTVYLDIPADDAAALSWVMATATKPTDGFMARHFDRHISLSISRLLLDSPITPNMMTAFSVALGLAGAFIFLDPARQFAGAVLVWLHSVTDGCDGELSRMRFEASRLGAALDFWGDNLVHVALWTCMALGFSRAYGSGLPLLPGAAAVAGTLGSAWLAFQAKSARGGGTGKLADATEALAQRDFIYLLVVVAGLGWSYYFLWVSGVGSLVFFAAMLQLRRNNRNEQAESPHTAR